MSHPASDKPNWLIDDNRALFLLRAEAELNVALQPIVDINSGRLVACESLVRGFDRLDFASIPDMFAHAVKVDALLDLECCLLEKAIAAFVNIRRHHGALLFINIDGRLANEYHLVRRALDDLVVRFGIERDSVCIELSERCEGLETVQFAEQIAALKDAGYLVAVDDFGTGVSGLQMIYHSRPDYLKIDRFFITSLDTDLYKQKIVSAIVNLCHMMGTRIIAEGVETQQELAACRDVLCDLAQGYLVQRPTTDVSEIQASYGLVTEQKTVEQSFVAQTQLNQLMEPMVALGHHASGAEILEHFGVYLDHLVVPVVDDAGRPRGVIRERDIKLIIYSPFGRDLLANKSLGFSVQRFLHHVPIVEIETPAEVLLDLISDKQADGVLITKDGRYAGYLSATGVARLANEVRLEQAADRNPLTGLPGNGAIKSFVGTMIDRSDCARVLCHLDIDDFKPYTDKYGVRDGDRVLTYFADLLQSSIGGTDVFIGHLGSDDFVLGAMAGDALRLPAIVSTALERFKRHAESCYNIEDRDAGMMSAVGRDGVVKQYALMKCTAAMLDVPVGVPLVDGDQVYGLLGTAIKRAKETRGALTVHEVDGVPKFETSALPERRPDVQEDAQLETPAEPAADTQADALRDAG